LEPFFCLRLVSLFFFWSFFFRPRWPYPSFSCSQGLFLDGRRCVTFSSPRFVFDFSVFFAVSLPDFLFFQVPSAFRLFCLTGVPPISPPFWLRFSFVDPAFGRPPPPLNLCGSGMSQRPLDDSSLTPFSFGSKSFGFFTF